MINVKKYWHKRFTIISFVYLTFHYKLWHCFENFEKQVLLFVSIFILKNLYTVGFYIISPAENIQSVGSFSRRMKLKNVITTFYLDTL